MPNKEGKYIYSHKPVLLNEVLEMINPQSESVYVDCTLGGAGHSFHILKASSPKGRLVGIDQDMDAIKAAADRLKEFGERAILIQGNFSDLPSILDKLNISKIDGILYDLGVSSYQLDNPERGFSYKRDAPLDMRMDKYSGVTASELVNTLSEEQLSRIIRKYGEERFAGRISSFIVREREKAPISTTGQLVDIIKQAIPARYRREGPHPAKRTFQALRIEVNKELDVLKNALESMVDYLNPGSRVCVITYHSLEDRLVKSFFRDKAAGCRCPKDFPVCTCNIRPVFKLIRPGGICPSDPEVKSNPRARSARLRVAERLDSPCSA